jgi:3-oxoacyl-[acyl-carrier-protein] synthase II
MRHRVAITGLGTVSSLGHTIEQNWERVCRRESGVSRFEFQGFEAFPHCDCGAIQAFDPASLIDNKKLLKLMNREAQLAFIAASRAIDHSGIRQHFQSDRMGVFLGTGLTTGELDALVPIVENSVDADGAFSYRLLGAHALAKCNPLLSFRILPNMSLSYISIEQKIQGPNMAFNPWPGNTVQAIIEAMRSIASGEIDCALTGGCDSKCNYVSFLTLDRLGLLSHTGSAASVSDGSIPGEGAACVILESFGHAQKRGARILAELCGGDAVTDCVSNKHFPTRTAPLEQAMRGALDDAGIKYSEIDFVCTSMNAHPQGDECELHAIGRVFENTMPRLTALSQWTGDLMAAAPAYALAMCAYSFGQKEFLPVLSIGGNEDGRVGMKNHAALINAFSSGTTKAALVIRNADA